MKEEKTNKLSPEEEERKKAIFDSMSSRGQKRVLRIGYEEWDPFQIPKDPIDIRGDKNKRTTHMLVREFLQTAASEKYGNDYARGVLDLCLGIINNDERYVGMYEFSCWYQSLQKKDETEGA
ncbi:MAG: hypothetical protein RBT11_02815 [Desulfobacterales bacterium]|jgi:hypothetical protein|nr:hypothetical protein [Desulfobacterales bacterium]